MEILMLYKKKTFLRNIIWAEKLFTIYFHERGQKKNGKNDEKR